jgi:hypothetical protein
MSDESEKKSVVQTVVMDEEVGPGNELHRGLKNRHAQMISWVPSSLPSQRPLSVILIDSDHIAASEG